MPPIAALTKRWNEPESWTLATYLRTDGYSALRTALTMEPDALIQLVKDSGLRGRGGAGFPTGMKWGFIPQGDDKPHYLVVNADEGEPGTCKDTPLMMADPHSLIEGIIISSFAVRCHHAFIYLRGELVARGPPAAAGDRRGLRRGLPRREHPRHRLRPQARRCTAAPAPTSAARRRRCSTRSRATAASRGCARRSRRRTGSTSRRRSSTTSSRSPASRSSSRNGVEWFRSGAPRSRPGRRSTRCPATSTSPGSTSCRMGTRCASSSSSPAASATATSSRPGRPAGPARRC